MLLKIAICDDEYIHRKNLLNMVQIALDSNNSGYSIFEFASGEELLASAKDFDIYFLDIRMDKMTGIETAKKIRQTNENAGIIFVTALQEYVFDAFDVRAFNYLLKPINEERLKDVLLSLLTHSKKRDHFIIAKTANESIKIFLKDIVYIEAQLRKMLIHTNVSVIEYYHKLYAIEKELDEHYFFRCHKSYIVNFKYIQSYDNSFITLCNSEKVYLSKHKYTDFAKAFMYYLKSGEH